MKELANKTWLCSSGSSKKKDKVLLLLAHKRWTPFSHPEKQYMYYMVIQLYIPGVVHVNFNHLRWHYTLS